jgi:homocysteine S-methyltransferase
MSLQWERSLWLSITLIIESPASSSRANPAKPQEEGVLISQEILHQLRPFVHGVYMMPAFGRYDLVADVLDILQEN